MPRSTSSRTQHASPASPPTHLERASAWAGVRAGDAVEVAGVRARSASWTFLAHVRNVRTGEEWVEVVGGRAGSRAVRSFRPEQILPPAPRSPGGGRRGAAGPPVPLVDAPRLPL